MAREESIRVEALKPDGHCYRYCSGALILQSSIRWVVETPSGPEIRANGELAWTQWQFIRMYFSASHHVNLLEVSDRQGKPVEVYANVASPTWSGRGMLRYTDYELDVLDVFAEADRPSVIHVDEFEDAIRDYGYSDELVTTCNAASRAVMAFVSG